MKFPWKTFFIVLLLLTALNLYWLTKGEFSFYIWTYRRFMFDEMWNSLIEGRVDLPYKAINIEAFEIGGKYYVYYGIFPALMRGLLNLFGYSFYGYWAAISCSIAMFLITVFTFLIFNEAITRKRLINLLLLAVVTTALVEGSPVLFTYLLLHPCEELIVWGYAFSLISIFSFIKFIQSSRRSTLSVAGLSIGACFGLWSRVTFGVPAYCLYFYSIFLLIKERKFDYYKGALLLIGVVGIAFQAWYNYERFGSVFSFLTLSAKHGYFNSKLIEHGGTFNIARIRESFFINLFPSRLIQYLSIEFPYFQRAAYVVDNPEIFAVSSQVVTPLFLVMPCAFLFMVWPFYRAVVLLLEKQYKTLLRGIMFLAPFFAETFMILCYSEGQDRFKVDFMPFILLGAFLCLRKAENKYLLYAIFITSILSIVFNILFTGECIGRFFWG